MASYTRQSTFADGDLITAALFNNEYNQLVSAFDNATGHKHDGTIGEGPVISVLGDAGLDTPLNKILIDTTNDHIEFWIDVSGTSTQQLYIADGAIVPTTDNDIDLGTNALQFKDLYLNGTANIDSLVADTIDINGGTIDGVTIGGTSAGAITGTTITGTSFVIGSATITETELEILDGATLSTTELNYVDGVTSNIQTQIDTKAPLSSPNLTGIPTAPTASANTNTTQVATTAYVQTEITDLIGAAPGTLDTLNELAAAINNDENYNTTLTTALATKLPLAGGTMTGNVTYGDNVKANFGTSEDLQIYHDGSNSYITDVGTGNLIITGNLTGNVTGTVSDISNHSTSDLSEGTNLYYTDARFDTRLATKDTDDVSEGTSNLYYTDARVQNVSINNVVEDTTPQLGGTLDLNSNNITGTGNIDVTGTVTSDGLTVDGDVALNDQSVTIGTTANSYNELRFFDSTNTGGTTRLRSNAGVFEAYTSNAKRIDISSGGDISFYAGTNQALFWDASTERLGLGTTSPTTTLDVNGTIKYGNLSDGTITITGFADEDNMASNSATLLPTQQSVKAYVDSQVSSAGGNGISFADNEKAQFGDGNDLQIYHTGSSSIIEDQGTGDLVIRGTDLYLRNSSNSNRLYAGTDVRLYYDGSEKIRTTNTGIDVTGTATMDGLTVDGVAKVLGTAANTIVIADATETNGYQLKANTSASADFGFIIEDLAGKDLLRIQSNGDISFYDDTGTSQALFWDASAESLGIGTTSPASTLEISKNDQTNGATLSITNSFEGSGWTAGDTIGTVDFRVDDGSTTQKVRGQIKVFDDTSVSTTYPAYNAMSFSTGNLNTLSERMRIDSSGNVGIGTTSPSYKLGFGDSVGTERFSIDVGTIEAEAIHVATANRHLTFDASGPGSRYISFKTGSTGYSGTERARIDSSGNVGISTTSPSDKLDIAGALRLTANISFDSNKSGRIYKASNHGLAFHGVTGTANDFAMFNPAGQLMVTNPTGTNNVSLIPSGLGNVGIGTDSPDTLLEVVGADPILTIRDTETTGALANTTLRLAESSGGDILGNYWDINLTGGTALAFKSSVVGVVNERMRIDSSGNVGIGTSSPDAKLDISFAKSATRPTIGAGTQLLIESTANTGAFTAMSILGGNSSGASQLNLGDVNDENVGQIGYYHADNSMRFVVNANERARIDSSGRVGIGTTSPSFKTDLNVNSTSASDTQVALRIKSTTTANMTDGFGVTQLFSVQDSSGSNFNIAQLRVVRDGADDSGAFVFAPYTTGTAIERMRIDSSGSLLAGKTSADFGSTQGFEVRTTGNTYITAPSVQALRLNRTGTDGNIAEFKKDGTTVGSIGVSGTGTRTYIGNNNSARTAGLSFVGSIGIYPFDSYNQVNADNTLDLGTSFARFKDLYLSGGLRVDATDSLRPSTDDSLINISGGNASNSGANYALFGETHASLAGVHRWRTNGSEAMRIDSSGNLLVGKTATDIALVGHQFLSDGQGDYAAHTSDGTRALLLNRKTSDGEIVDFRKDGTVVGSIGIESTGFYIDGESGHTGLSFISDGILPRDNGALTNGLTDVGSLNYRFRDLYLSGGLRGDTTFKNNAGTTEYARFDSSGNLLVGKTSANDFASAGVQIEPAGQITTSIASDSALRLNRGGTDGTIIELNKSGSTVGSIATTSGAINLYGGSGTNGITVDSSGNLTATANVTAYSDERLKDNIKTLQGSKVLEMRGVSYTKDGEASSGVIAQEIEKVAPELVHTAKDEMGTKSVAYGNLVGYLIEAIKDQQNQIDELKARLDNDSSK